MYIFPSLREYSGLWMAVKKSQAILLLYIFHKLLNNFLSILKTNENWNRQIILEDDELGDFKKLAHNFNPSINPKKKKIYIINRE